MATSRRLCTALLLLPSLAHAGAPFTGLPDFVESSGTVGRSRVQLDLSVSRMRDAEGTARAETVATPLVLSVGLTDRVDLRLETDGAQRDRAWDGGATANTRGWNDWALAAKYALPVALPGDGIASVLGKLYMPTGGSALRGTGLRPSLRLIAQWPLGESSRVTVSPGIFNDTNEQGRRYTAALLGVMLSRSVSPNVELFVQAAAPQIARRRDGGHTATLDAGVSVGLGEDRSCSAALTHGLTDASTDHGVTLAFSQRF